MIYLLRHGQQSRLFRGGSVRRMPGGLEALQNLMKPCAEVPLLDFVVELLGIAQAEHAQCVETVGTDTQRLARAGAEPVGQERRCDR